MTIYRGYNLLTKLKGSNVVVYKIIKNKKGIGDRVTIRHVHMSFHEAFKYIDGLEGTGI